MIKNPWLNEYQVVIDTAEQFGRFMLDWIGKNGTPSPEALLSESIEFAEVLMERLEEVRG